MLTKYLNIQLNLKTILAGRVQFFAPNLIILILSDTISQTASQIIPNWSLKYNTKKASFKKPLKLTLINWLRECTLNVFGNSEIK